MLSEHAEPKDPRTNPMVEEIYTGVDGEQGIRYKANNPVGAYTFPTQARAKLVTFDDAYMHIHLTDGRIISVPIHWMPTVAEAAPEEREKYQIDESGLVVYWDPDYCLINDDFYVFQWLEDDYAKEHAGRAARERAEYEALRQA
jgi:hypothetical protein